MEKPPLPFDRERLVRIAAAQRAVIMLYLVYILWGFVLSFAAAFLNMKPTESSVVLLNLLSFSVRRVLFVFVAINGIRLAKGVEGENALPYQIAFCIPCLNLIPLLILSSRSNRIMRENGIKVGFLGVSPSDIP